MQPDFIRHMLLDAIGDQTGKPGSGLSREYIFQRKYAAHRANPAWIAGNGPAPSRQQFLFDTMAPDERTHLFPGNFDLGNMKASGPATMAALSAELRNDPNKYDATSFLRDAKEGKLEEVTGYSFNEYFEQDPRKALKVLKTLYLLSIANDRQMFAFLAAPGLVAGGQRTKRASLDVARTFPREVGAAGVSLLSDLTAHLTLELPPAKRDELNELFGGMRDRIGQIYSAFIKAASDHASGNVDRFDGMLERIRGLLEQGIADENVPSKPLFLPLDEKLYVHCLSLEYLNYVQVQREIEADLSPSITIRSIDAQMDLIEKEVRMATKRANIPLSYFEEFTRTQSDTILPALQEGLGYPIKRHHYDNAIPRAFNALRMHLAFSLPGGLAALAHSSVPPLTAVAALAAVCHQHHHPTTYRPYCMGQVNKSGSVVSALDRIDLGSAHYQEPEEYNRFWDHHIKWFGHALLGRLDTYKQKLAIQRHLNDAFEEAVRLHDVALLRGRLDHYAQLASTAAAILGRQVNESSKGS